jgi:hypothetical protein
LGGEFETKFHEETIKRRMIVIEGRHATSDVLSTGAFQGVGAFTIFSVGL